MRLTRHSELAWLTRPDFGSGDKRAAKDKTQYQDLHKGDPRQPGHFEMVVTRYPATKDVPRHKHAHDQLRYTLAGTSPWAPGMATPTGSIVYIPSGTAYGPYERPTDIELLSIEFEGANAAPFVDVDTLYEAHVKLSTRGTFEKNVYRWLDDDGTPHKLSAGRARLQEVLGSAPEPPRPRFSTPVEFHPNNFEWRPIAAGAYVREMIALGERGTKVSMLRVDSGAAFDLKVDQTTLLFVTGGSGTASEESIVERDSLCLGTGETVVLAGTGSLEILSLGLPRATTP